MMRSRICSSNSRGSVARRLVSRIRDRITANWFFTRWFTSRIKSRMRRSFSFAVVMSRAIFDAPTILPLPSLIGETVSDTETKVPSLRRRVVS